MESRTAPRAVVARSSRSPVFLASLQRRQTVEAPGIIRVLLAEHRLSDLQRLPVERFGLRIVPLVLIQACQVVEALGVIRVLLAKRRFEYFRRLPVERFGLTVVPLGTIQK